MRQIGIVVLAVIVGGAAWWFGRPPPIEPLAPMVPVTAETGNITVHVSGAVVAPGLVALPAGSRVADAIAAAGGADRRADLAALNLASVVGDEQHIIVPARSAAAGAIGVVADGRVRLNSATAAELEALPGVGPVLAERIVEHREAVGAFSVVEDLLDVSGIGEAKLATIRDHLIVP